MLSSESGRCARSRPCRSARSTRSRRPPPRARDLLQKVARVELLDREPRDELAELLLGVVPEGREVRAVVRVVRAREAFLPRNFAIAAATQTAATRSAKDAAGELLDPVELALEAQLEGAALGERADAAGHERDVVRVHAQRRIAALHRLVEAEAPEQPTNTLPHSPQGTVSRICVITSRGTAPMNMLKSFRYLLR